MVFTSDNTSCHTFSNIDFVLSDFECVQENPDLFKWLTGQQEAPSDMQANAAYLVRAPNWQSNHLGAVSVRQLVAAHQTSEQEKLSVLALLFAGELGCNQGVCSAGRSAHAL
jgi:hypothetical protein